MEFNDYREKFPEFEYNFYSINDDGENIVIKYKFEICGLEKFEPTIKIAKKNFAWKSIKSKKVQAIVFYLGMVEAMSYFKATCSPRFYINCGKLDEYQKEWFSKLYYLGLGEFRYRNGIRVEQKDFVEFVSYGNSIIPEEDKENANGIIIPVGGGKDSCVTLDLLSQYKEECLAFRIGKNEVSTKCCEIAGYDDDKVIEVTRLIDKNLLDLNSQGYLNGHTPFSAIVAFITYLVAHLLGKKYVALSNEDSANQSNVVGEQINHQYSKTYEFETDFRKFVGKYIGANVNYFSMLRPITEIQIAKLFSKQKEYHTTFKSCNVGSKQKPWIWCCDCPKCLFVYTILSPFLSQKDVEDIFGENLFNKQSLKETFLELCGFSNVKPFECVGTFEEVQYAVSQTIKHLEAENKELPYLLQLYKDNYPLRDGEFETYFSTKHHVPLKFENILKEKLEIK